MKNLKKNWNISYINKDNFLFYPNEELIRFVNRHIQRKINLKTKINKKIFLDIGCGVGRNMKYLIENGYTCYGIDLSLAATKYAKKFLTSKNLSKKKFHLFNQSSSKLPFKNESIDYIIADSSLDSMPIKDIRKTISEAYRVLKKGGLFYSSLIKKENNIAFKSTYYNLGQGNYQVISKHEKNTIQVFFDTQKIKRYFKFFKIKELFVNKKIYFNKSHTDSRYHLICQKKIKEIK